MFADMRSLIKDGGGRTGQFDQIAGENTRHHHHTDQQTGKYLNGRRNMQGRLRLSRLLHISGL